MYLYHSWKNFMFNLECKKKWFTLAEVVIVCSLFAIIVVWIILAINRAFAFIDNTRLSVRATNLAREGVEMVYNIRDTNRRKYSGEKDKYRMTTRGTGGNVYLSSWVYVIKEWTTWTDHYIYAYRLTWNVNLYDNIETFFSDSNASGRNESKILFTWVYKYYSWWTATLVTWNLEDLVNVSWLEFYRLLRVYGVYKKNDSSPSLSVPSSSFDDWTPKELRFCVKVFYQSNGWRRSSELCSIMTNFMK